MSQPKSEDEDVVYINDLEVAADGKYYAPGTDIVIGDDLALKHKGNCKLVYYDLMVIGGHDGAFDVHTELWSGNPCGNGAVIPGTAYEWFGVDDDGRAHLLSASFDPPIDLPSVVWLTAHFSTKNAAWLIANEADVGFTRDVFIQSKINNSVDCGSYNFGGPPSLPYGGLWAYGGFWASVRCDSDELGACCVNGSCSEVLPEECDGFWRGPNTVCEPNNPCSLHFPVFENNLETQSFLTIERGTQLADDLVLDTAGASCSLAQYEVFIIGAAGSSVFIATLELWTNDLGEDGVPSGDDLPLAPIVGTRKVLGDGVDSLLAYQVAQKLEAGPFDGSIILPEKVWMVIETSTDTSGPMMSGLGDVGASLDSYAIYEEGKWSLIPNLGGFDPSECLQRSSLCVAAGSFQARVLCYGESATGACCDRVSGLCVDDTPLRHCNVPIDGWLPDTSCQEAEFDPPCGLTTCCLPDVSQPDGVACQNSEPLDCVAEGGVVQLGSICEYADCGSSVCFNAEGDCYGEHGNAGCSNHFCCNLVCEVDAVCCSGNWDSRCISLADQVCVAELPATDACTDAITINEGKRVFTTRGSTTDGPLLPPGCDDGIGVSMKNDIWYRWVAPGDAPADSILTLNLCDKANYDTRIAVYEGCDCPPLNLVACDDDGCGEYAGPSIVSLPVTANTCYLIRVGGFDRLQAGDGTLTLRMSTEECPSGEAVVFLDPPNGVVDAGQPHPVNSKHPQAGISVLTVQAPHAAINPKDCFELCETRADGEANDIIDVREGPSGTYTITLARPLTPGAVTSLTYTGTGETGFFTAHPANVDGDSSSGPMDILAVIDCLNRVNVETACPWGRYSSDVDHSGETNPTDILRVIDLLNGAGEFDAWYGTNLPSTSGCPRSSLVNH